MTWLVIYNDTKFLNILDQNCRRSESDDMHVIYLLGSLIINVMGVSVAQESLQIISSAFNHNQQIPSKYTCDDQNISPQLSWSGMPANTKSFVLIVDDPDAKQAVGKLWVHWLVFNIPASITQLQEAVDIATIPGAKQGKNDFGKLSYGGPCPPSGTHRYFFKLYALDALLDLQEGATKAQLEDAMQGHIVGQSQLIGLYSRNK